MMSAARGLGAVLVLFACFCAHADEQSDLQAARQHYQKGAALFDLERYDDAIKEYEAAYQMKNDPSILFNIAQAHRKAHHVAEAIHFYRAYLARKPNADNRARVDERIAELERELAKGPTQTTPPIVNRPVTAPIVNEPQTTAPPAESATAPVAIVATPRRPVRGRLVAGIGLGVAGLGLSVGGIVLSVLSAHAADQLTLANQTHAAYDPHLYSTYQNDAIAGGVMLGVGVAALAAGGVLIAIDIKHHRGERGNLALNR
jgi:tetratricopeptide (TPR) repeat protein